MSSIKLFLKLIILLGILMQPGIASAHAVVTGSSLQIEPIPPNKETKIKLSFNSNIELGLSQIFLVSEGDKQVLLQTTSGHEPGLIVIDIPALEPGEYALRFRVFAADGHLTEDIIRFRVTQ
jgi:copper resistance protein C